MVSTNYLFRSRPCSESWFSCWCLKCIDPTALVDLAQCVVSVVWREGIATVWVLIWLVWCGRWEIMHENIVYFLSVFILVLYLSLNTAKCRFGSRAGSQVLFLHAKNYTLRPSIVHIKHYFQMSPSQCSYPDGLLWLANVLAVEIPRIPPFSFWVHRIKSPQMWAQMRNLFSELGFAAERLWKAI